MQQGYYSNYYQPMYRVRPPVQTQPPVAHPQTTQSNFETAPDSPTLVGTDYTQGYLRTQIGKRMRVTFLLGTNLIQDRVGVLEQVGISFITLKEDDTGNLVMCDIYSIKFVNIFK